MQLQSNYVLYVRDAYSSAGMYSKGIKVAIYINTKYETDVMKVLWRTKRDIREKQDCKQKTLCYICPTTVLYKTTPENFQVREHITERI